MAEKFRENGQFLITLGLIISAITIIVALFLGKENNFPYFFFAILISAILLLFGILLYVLGFIFNKHKKSSLINIIRRNTMKAKALTSIGFLIAFITLIVGSIVATNSSVFLFFFFLFMAISVILIVVGAFLEFFYLIDKK